MESETSSDYQLNILIDVLSEMVTNYLSDNNIKSEEKGSVSDENSNHSD
ncbi:hypothetical protein [Bacillus sp. FJAT-50079]|nr:hypothetical protein [Bacillus sp. FJAT-50079]MBS4207120.1 hypothetical protein [Bacillus sp. FJAT-50079]